jgi:hypothetical protein
MSTSKPVKATAQPPRQTPPSPRRSSWVERSLFGLVVLAAVIAAATLWRVGDRGVPSASAGPVHVHGLGVNPADGALFIATHTGLFRVGVREKKAARVGDSFQDTMGFTVVGENRFLGSGHPDVRTDLPPLLGLIESTDEGRTWDLISLLGEADFHVLRSAGKRVYGYDASNDRLLISADAGRTWSETGRPAPLVDLAVDPAGGRHVIATGASNVARGLYESDDGGQSWERIGNPVGYLAWVDSDTLFLVEGSGDVFVSRDAGVSFDRRGSIGGEPAALLGQAADELYVALHDGTIKQSSDGGATWVVRSTP